MRNDRFDDFERRQFEIQDVMLGPCPLLAAMEADDDLESRWMCPMGSLPEGWVWKPETRSTWHGRKRHALNVGVHIFWSMQVNAWKKSLVC